MKRAGVLLAAAGLAGMTLLPAAGQEIAKKWSFSATGGTVEIAVSRPAHRSARAVTLEIYGRNGGSATLMEEAGFFDAVLKALPKEGIGVETLEQLNLRLYEPEAVARVATCAARTKEWRGAEKSKKSAVISRVVTACLNNSEAYGEWESVFNQYGLTLHAADAQRVMLVQFASAQAECPPGVDCRNLLVPADAMVEMMVEPIARR
jgi:hypothetical protein